MTYSSNVMLNAAVKKAHPSEEARTVFRNAFNTAFGNKMKEGTCFAIAHAAANKITKNPYKKIHEDADAKIQVKQKKRQWMIKMDDGKRVYDGPSKKRSLIGEESMNHIQEVTDAYLRKHVASAVKRSTAADQENDTNTTGKVYKFLTKSRTAKRLGFTPDKASQDQNPRDMRFKKVGDKLVREFVEMIDEGRRKIKPKEDWHKNDPDALLTHVYWMHGHKPPTNHAVKLSAYQSIVKQLNKQNPCEDPKILDKHLNHFRKAAKKSLMSEAAMGRPKKEGGIGAFLKQRAAENKAAKEAKRQAQFQGRMAKMSAPKPAAKPAVTAAPKKTAPATLEKGATYTPTRNAKYTMTPEMHAQVQRDMVKHKSKKQNRENSAVRSAKIEFKNDQATSKRIHRAKTAQPKFVKSDIVRPVDNRSSYEHLRGVAKLKSETAITGEGHRRQHIEAALAHKAAGAHPDAPKDHSHISMNAKHLDLAKKAPKALKVKVPKAKEATPSNARRHRFAASLARKDYESDDSAKNMTEGYKAGQRANTMKKYQDRTEPEDRVRRSQYSPKRTIPKEWYIKKAREKASRVVEAYLDEAKHLLTLRAGGDLPFTKKSLTDSGGELHHHGPNGESVYAFNSFDKLQHFRAVSRHRNRDPDAVRNKEYIDIQHEDDKAVDESNEYMKKALIAHNATKQAHTTNDKLDHFKAAYCHKQALQNSPTPETSIMHADKIAHHTKRSDVTEEIIAEKKRFWLPKGGTKILKKRPANMPMRAVHAVERADIKALHVVVSEETVRRPGSVKPSLGALGQSFGSGSKDDRDALKNPPTGGLTTSHHEREIRNIMTPKPTHAGDESSHANWAHNTVSRIRPGTHIQMGQHQGASHGEYVGKHPREAGKHVYQNNKGKRFSFHPTSVTHVDGKEITNPHKAPVQSRPTQTTKSTLDRDWNSKE